ncbi:unnamed protein product, partial [Phaeothamnion confervicola]
FLAAAFLRFPQDRFGRISTQNFFKHVYGSICLQKTKITLHYYDTEGRGWLREQDLENYVYDLIPTMPTLQSMHDNFFPFYVFTAVRRFMFFLDPKRTGKIAIDVLVRSRIMDELLELGMAGADESGGGGNGGGGGGGSDSSPDVQPAQDLSKNWFSADNALRVYSEYLELDADQNGMLSRRELLNY